MNAPPFLLEKVQQLASDADFFGGNVLTVNDTNNVHTFCEVSNVEWLVYKKSELHNTNTNFLVINVPLQQFHSRIYKSE